MWIKTQNDELVNSIQIQSVEVFSNNSVINVVVLLEGRSAHKTIASVSSVSNAKKVINRIFQQMAKSTNVIDIGLLVNQVESEK